ncbi:DUF4177 domain-containing protein [Streptomyces afghaniensis]|uniref:DUF4177 domain-containing protein n=1 Tax=Streptomyces afghaniensis TaxID=66865 RepID=UPI00277D4BEA|nr:DUF4177 domain-containing protein [Streptomyces afghaniensis]MDQ1022383.1 hypothetical protein [Streptomyces afghaniensis]
MELWENKFVIVSKRDGHEVLSDIDEMLERHGREGWQLVSHHGHAGGVPSWSFTFKRPLNS